jgi:hypothetical protein
MLVTDASTATSRTSTVTLPIIAPVQGAAPEWIVEPVAAETGLIATVGKTPPNPRNVRGVLSVAASLVAPPGPSRVTVKTDEGSTSVEIIVKPLPSIALDREQRVRETIASDATEFTLANWFVWIAQGAVMQRLANVDSPVAGLTDVRAVGLANGVAYAVTNGGTLFKWTATTTPERVLEGIADVHAGPFAVLALEETGTVIDVQTLQHINDMKDVVAIRSSGFVQQIINGGGQYRATSRFFLKQDGAVEQRSSVEYLSQQLPDTSDQKVIARSATDVTGAGFVLATDGRAYLQSSFLHDLRARKIASPPRTSSQSNATTFSSANACYVLFDDGALWLTTISKTTGENQQGAPTSREGLTQVPVRAPGDVKIDGFHLLGAQVLISTATGFFLSDASLRFQPVSFPGLE